MWNYRPNVNLYPGSLVNVSMLRVDCLLTYKKYLQLLEVIPVDDDELGNKHKSYSLVAKSSIGIAFNWVEALHWISEMTKYLCPFRAHFNLENKKYWNTWRNESSGICLPHMPNKAIRPCSMIMLSLILLFCSTGELYPLSPTLLLRVVSPGFFLVPHIETSYEGPEVFGHFRHIVQCYNPTEGYCWRKTEVNHLKLHFEFKKPQNL